MNGQKSRNIENSASKYLGIECRSRSKMSRLTKACWLSFTIALAMLLVKVDVVAAEAYTADNSKLNKNVNLLLIMGLIIIILIVLDVVLQLINMNKLKNIKKLQDDTFCFCTESDKETAELSKAVRNLESIIRSGKKEESLRDGEAQDERAHEQASQNQYMNYSTEEANGQLSDNQGDIYEYNHRYSFENTVAPNDAMEDYTEVQPQTNTFEYDMELINLYNLAQTSEDSKTKFFTLYEVKQVSVLNSMEWRLDKSIKKVFGETSPGEYYAVVMKNEGYDTVERAIVLPKIGLYIDSNIYEAAAIGEIYQCTGYNEGKVYKQVHVVSPAVFRITPQGEWIFEHDKRGRLMFL